jgi:nucleotide-binding universal stress UspA family protein
MATTTLLCTDGSDQAIHALAEGLAVLAPADRTVVVTVVDPPDTSLVTGDSGFGAGVMTPQELETEVAEHIREAHEHLQRTVEQLGLVGAETMVIEGEPAHALHDLAVSLPASVVVIGTHGRGGLGRAVLGSTSDHLVRHSTCPVVVTRLHH